MSVLLRVLYAATGAEDPASRAPNGPGRPASPRDCPPREGERAMAAKFRALYVHALLWWYNMFNR